MSWQKGWVFLVPLCALLSPLNLEAKVNLRDMNLLENVETRSTQDELIIKFNFKKDLKFFQKPIFYEKSIQIDFPFAYSQPAKRFLTTGNSQISQIYVSQFNAQKMRIRFILGKGRQGNYDKRFHLQKEGNALAVRIDLKPIDILDTLLALTTAKIKEEKQKQPLSTLNADDNKKNVKEPPLYKAKKAMMTDSDDLKNGLSDKIKTASFNKNPKWKEDKGKPEKFSKSVTKSSFNLLNPGNKKTSKSAGLVSSGFKMIMTLSVVLGLIFLLFFGFKKYVLKNTVFGGGGKLIQVVSTNYLAPKKNISLVEVAGEILVLGISDQNISLLTSIREPGRIEDIKKAQGYNAGNPVWQQGIPGGVVGKVSLATSNAKNLFSNYLKEFSGAESNKQASVAAVTEKIRRHMGKVRPA